MNHSPEKRPSTASPGAHFATTRWTVVMAARDKASPESASALQALCAGYWPPLYAFVRRLGNSPQDAEDLTQEFFARLLQKDWLDAVERDRGRFRTFLIMAVKRFLANEWDKSRAARRGGGQALVSLDAEFAEQCYLADAGPALSADHLYERRWALTLLEQAMARLRTEYESDGRGEDFGRLKIHLTAERGEIPYDEIARELGASEGAARVAVHRLRKRFREVFRATVADTVSSAEDVEAEMHYVVEVLGRV
ncbi:RNA polymerase, sigma-24 subunit, ECF subfamily [Chthoniobacter flavus Ellin428]|uniref:RNA polymerase, sigma-24 subunit, ECF subfamily n=1 Tax=Chthoniobacter flavus Ellin428 TaxID=497964 RepID=B4D257_9BACT|nr:sigma-70 family RNA polymerase sigma factor [Chthoniobacter flavus]EDY19297.1 RNA polymerase, sigma-24 subunit, ECF subfamily [Chthoniobacter flavus Ellin428]TCO90570.1 RNA polymerase sigma-70 factor (ECF subfamily) [Chthoniobacter flavus]